MESNHVNTLKRFAEEVRISVKPDQRPPVPSKSVVKALEDFGRVQLSRHYFMRDFLYSEISAVHRIPNIPDDPELAIKAGKGLCEHLLEPLREIFGHITIRSAFRSATVNKFGNENGYACGNNEGNRAHHIWDRRDNECCMGATACIVVPWFLDYPGYRDSEGKAWWPLAWFIHDTRDKLPYSKMVFYQKYAAFNLTWREKCPRHEIKAEGCTSAIFGGGSSEKILTKPGHDNHEGDHSKYYQEFPGI